MFHPSYNTFAPLSHTYNLIPVFTEYFEDTETPVSIYLKIKATFSGPSFLLESVEQGQTIGRYSFIGFEPWQCYASKGARGRVSSKDGGGTVRDGPPTRVLSSLLNNYNVPVIPGLEHFFGGAVGYFAYDTARYLEKLPAAPPDDLQLPECLVMFPATIVVIDHLRKRVKIITLVTPGSNPKAAYNSATNHLNDIRKVLESNPKVNNRQPKCNLAGDEDLSPTVNVGREEFCSMVEKALDYIKAGDILQVVLSRRYTMPCRVDPLDTFRRLRSLNPSPYMFYLDFGDPVILGTSPEMLVKVDGRAIHTRPIAGTRPRGADELRDKELEKDLLLDEKERAEHLMLVDLGRNDLGRVCVPGSVEVPNFMSVERFSHVMHLVSDVQGILSPEKDPIQALEACFPAGTVSGAPKIRAMEIIDELEPCRRGVYAGAVGYAGFGNMLDTAIAIRTVVISGGKAHVQAGAGIVADSVPEKEYLETENKAGALLQALGAAQVEV